MLIEIIHNQKNKRVIIVSFIGIMACIFYLITIKRPIIAKQFISSKVIENVQTEKLITANYWINKVDEMQLADVEKVNTEHIKPGSDELPQEFYAFEGKWEVGEYLDMAVEFSGVDIEEAGYQERRTQYINSYREEYEGFTFEIREDSVEQFCETNEWGYHYDDYGILFMIYRQPPYLGIEPPFLCASIQLKGADDFFDIIIDNNGKAIFEAGHVFFELNRVN